MAAMTAQVARIVGLPTSPTASMATGRWSAAAVAGQSHVADDIFNDDNGIIDQDTDGKNQGKQSDAVEGIAVEVKDRAG